MQSRLWFLAWGMAQFTGGARAFGHEVPRVGPAAVAPAECARLLSPSPTDQMALTAGATREIADQVKNYEP